MTNQPDQTYSRETVAAAAAAAAQADRQPFGNPEDAYWTIRVSFPDHPERPETPAKHGRLRAPSACAALGIAARECVAEDYAELGARPGDLVRLTATPETAEPDAPETPEAEPALGGHCILLESAYRSPQEARDAYRTETASAAFADRERDLLAAQERRKAGSEDELAAHRASLYGGSGSGTGTAEAETARQAARAQWRAEADARLRAADRAFRAAYDEAVRQAAETGRAVTLRDPRTAGTPFEIPIHPNGTCYRAVDLGGGTRTAIPGTEAETPEAALALGEADTPNAYDAADCTETFWIDLGVDRFGFDPDLAEDAEETASAAASDSADEAPEAPEAPEVPDWIGDPDHGMELTVHPQEPPCPERLDEDEPDPPEGKHDWQDGQAYGHGGGVVWTDTCKRCGLERTTDTWGQRPDTGSQPHRTIRYEDPAQDQDAADLAAITDRLGIRDVADFGWDS